MSNSLCLPDGVSSEKVNEARYRLTVGSADILAASSKMLNMCASLLTHSIGSQEALSDGEVWLRGELSAASDELTGALDVVIRVDERLQKAQEIIDGKIGTR